MKKTEHIKEAQSIGDDSYELVNFVQLPLNAAAGRQVEALKKDQEWQRNHQNIIARNIDALIQEIEL